MLDSSFDDHDELGPEKVIQLYDPEVGLKAFVVVDNTAKGAAIGGTRMAPDVSVEECARLARAMTLKNAAAGLTHGGAKSVIAADPKMPIEEKERLMRAFAYAIKDIEDYIPGPDMGTDEVCMAWVKDSNGRAVGLPQAVGGIPLDEIGATGWGLVCALEVAQQSAGITLAGASFVVQGFGSVGQHAARFLVERGANMVAVSDSSGAIVDHSGIDVQALVEFKNQGNSVIDFAEVDRISHEDLVGIETDIWIPAARPDVINDANVDEVKCKIIAQGANIPVSTTAEAILHERGVLCLPDFIANAGGVICASVEYHGGTQTQAMEVIKDKISRNVRAVLTEVERSSCLPREAANLMAKQLVQEAMKYRKTN